MPFVYVAIMALADEQENELGLFDNVVVEMDVAQEECVIDSDISVMFAADQPCTSPTVHSDTAVVVPAFAQRKCILCCIDRDENLQALTSVGIQSLIDNCNPTGMTHIGCTRVSYAAYRCETHPSCWLKAVNQACRACKAKTASRDSAKVSTRSVAGAFSFKDMCFFCGESVTGYDKANIRQV